jgi:hypothetical protein
MLKIQSKFFSVFRATVSILILIDLIYTIVNWWQLINLGVNYSFYFVLPFQFGIGSIIFYVLFLAYNLPKGIREMYLIKKSGEKFIWRFFIVLNFITYSFLYMSLILNEESSHAIKMTGLVTILVIISIIALYDLIQICRWTISRLRTAE